MKRCTNCWTDNSDDAERCKKCGRVLGESWWHNHNYRLYWEAVASGLLTAVILYLTGYLLIGGSKTFFLATIPILLAVGAVTTILAYRKEADIANALINSLAVGFIVGFSFIAVVMGSSGGSAPPVMILILIPVLALWTMIGGKIGAVINVAVENGRKSTIIIAAIIITIISLGGYGAYQFTLYANYDNGAYGSAYDLDFVDIIQPEADAYLNAPYNTSKERLSNLNNAKVKYERMVNITVGTQPQVDEMIGNSTSSIKKEYALALNQYLHLKHDYCLEMYTGIQLEIKGNTAEAQKHYQNAEALIPKIQSQNDQITAIINKDQSFKSYITEKRNEAREYSGRDRAENMTFTPS